MSELLALYQYAEAAGHDVYWYSFDDETESLSVQFPDGSCAIAINPYQLSSWGDETVKLAHEIGHCETGAFYNRHAACDIRRKHENRADKWAIKALIPEDELDAAVADGCTDMWALAERFGVTEDFMRKAVCWYTYGNLATELHF